MIGMYGDVFDDVRSVQGIIEDCTFDPNVQSYWENITVGENGRHAALPWPYKRAWFVLCGYQLKAICGFHQR